MALLGIDIGTSGTKTLLCDKRGRVLATATAAHTLETPKPDWSEQDPAQWWSATRKAVKAVLKKAKLDGAKVTGIGLSGQMHGGVFLDDAGAVLRPAILWNDQRTGAQCVQIEDAAGGRRKLIGMVGNPALTGFTAPKMLWVREHEPRVWKKTRRVLLPKDYIRFRMTDTYATEVSDASGTLLLDVKKRRWNTALMKRLDLDPALMPECFESHVVSSHLSDAGAKALGLKAGTPVVGGGGDQAAGAVGAGVVARGIVSATLGTSGVVFAHSDEPTYDKHGRVHTMCSAVDGKWCVFGCMLSAAGSFQWYRDTFAPKASFDTLVAEATEEAHLPGGDMDGLHFLPYLTGERCPYPDPDARGCFIGLRRGHDRGAVTRSVLEGVTFGMADQVRIMADEMGIAMKTIRLGGGGAKSPVWRQLQADIYGRPVATVNAEEGPAYGVALLAGVGTGVWRSVPEACRAAIGETERRTPQRKMSTHYKQKHGTYTRLYHALAPEFAGL